jgi:hypothetical protein
MMCCINDDECTCECHSGCAVHIVACCYICPECDKKISTYNWETHQEKHRGLPEQ